MGSLSRAYARGPSIAQIIPGGRYVQCGQATLDELWSISKTPGDQPGAELPLEDLIRQKIQEHVSKK